jgi:hypothetical protein
MRCFFSLESRSNNRVASGENTVQSNIDIVRSYYQAIDQGDLKQADQFLSDDFRRFGFTHEPMDKHETIDIVRRLQEAMPNFKHALSNLTEQGRTVKLTVQTGGRHTQPLDLSYLGMGISEGIVPSSGRMIIFEPNDLEFTVINGKITAEHDVTTAKHFNGVAGFLQAIGFAD